MHQQSINFWKIKIDSGDTNFSFPSLFQNLKYKYHDKDIYGSPGLGKTCSVNKVLSEYPEGEIMRINGLKFTSRIELQEMKERKVSVIVVDEFDEIENKKKLLLQIRNILRDEKLILISNTNSNNLIFDVRENVQHLPFNP